MDGNGFYLIQFYHVVDLKKIISSSPWSFNNCFLLVRTQGGNLKDVNFYYADSRIQVHNDFFITLEDQMSHYTISIYAFATDAQLTELNLDIIFTFTSSAFLIFINLFFLF
ncbi:hypothetical protein PVK06_018304 [Gossypium arboreum]|uniref:DUF4283 domain-containing protein n=1 Tax=Gossypium arboreum TaxID=29729 RepID=A0ABR0Q5Y1_GOSAR|nr:hypothetical protein PVK06_018304 [Gossypium arboreum]